LTILNLNITTVQLEPLCPDYGNYRKQNFNTRLNELVSYDTTIRDK